jgi:HlyD family secretion protein
MWGRLIGIVVGLLIVAGVAWALWPRPLSVETALIERRDLTVTVEEEGTSRIREIFRVSAPVAGRLTRVTMHVGDAVSAGQTVASIEPAGPGLLDERSRRMAQAAVEAAAAGVALAEANLAQSEAQFEYATAELKRTTALAGQALVSTQVEQRSVLEAATAREGLVAAKATLLIRQQELASAKAALIEGEGEGSNGACCADVRAPAAGRVLEVLTESEQVVQPGTALMEIGDPTDLEIVVEVLSSDAVRLSEGAEATIERWGGEPLRAAIKRIDPVAVTRTSALGIEEQRTRVVLELLDGPEARQRLGHGFRVVAKIVIWKGTDLVTIPMGALFRRGDAWAAFVVEGGTARVRTVSLGQRNDEHAEVVAGLDAGEMVIVHPGDTVEDGRTSSRRLR